MAPWRKIPLLGLAIVPVLLAACGDLGVTEDGDESGGATTTAGSAARDSGENPEAGAAGRAEPTPTEAGEGGGAGAESAEAGAGVAAPGDGGASGAVDGDEDNEDPGQGGDGGKDGHGQGGDEDDEDPGQGGHGQGGDGGKDGHGQGGDEDDEDPGQGGHAGDPTTEPLGIDAVLASHEVGSVDYELVCGSTWRSDCEYNCDQCLDACASLAITTGDSSCYETAQDVCCNCAESSNDCNSWRHAFTFPESDPAITEACQDYRAAMETECELTFPDYYCESFARVEDRAMVANYQCLAAALRAGDCELDHPQCQPEPGTLGTDLCAQLALQTEEEEECPLEHVAALNDMEGWLREDVREAATICFEPDIVLPNGRVESADCLQAWENSVTLYERIPHEE